MIFKYNFISYIDCPLTSYVKKAKYSKDVKFNKTKNPNLFSLTVNKGLFVCKEVFCLLLILVIVLELCLFALTLLLLFCQYTGNVNDMSFTSFTDMTSCLPKIRPFYFPEQEVSIDNATCSASSIMGFTNNKRSIFDPFIKLFYLGECPVRGKCDSYCFVSMFIPYNMYTSEKIAPYSFCLAEYIVYHEFYKVFLLQDFIEDLKGFNFP